MSRGICVWHKFVCIQVAAVHIDTSSARVQFALVQVVTVQVLFVWQRIQVSL